MTRPAAVAPSFTFPEFDSNPDAEVPLALGGR